MVVSAANLDPDALPRKLLCARSASSAVKGITRLYHQVLSDLNFPGLSSLLSEPPKCSPWKAFIKKHLGLTSYLTLLEKCYASQCAFKPHHPAPHWKVTIKDPTCLNNFRICLLVGCDRLEGDAACFSNRTTSARPGDPSCKLCNQGVSGDAAYFVSTCPVLNEERVKLYSEAPPTVCSQIPDPRAHPQNVLEVMTGTCWVDDTNVQKFCIHFLSKLKAAITGPINSRTTLLRWMQERRRNLAMQSHQCESY